MLSVSAVLVSFAVPRLIDADPYEAIIVKNNLVSIVRLGQQRAMSASNVDVYLAQSSGDYSVTVREGGVEFASLLISDVAVTAGDASDYANCSSLNTSRDIDFDATGQIASAFPSGVQICLNTENAVCISSSGFAYIGQCE